MMVDAVHMHTYSVHMHTRHPSHDDCFAVRQAARHISQLYERHLSAVRITPTQFSIVSALARMPEMTMAELAQAMVMERTTLVRVLPEVAGPPNEAYFVELERLTAASWLRSSKRPGMSSAGFRTLRMPRARRKRRPRARRMAFPLG